MNQRKKISAIIITRNEGSRIASCMESVKWADDVIVIDNGSSDDTVVIAIKQGAVVLKTDIHDFSKIRNLGAESTKGEWLLYVDADELVTPQLREEILTIVNEKHKEVAYFISRQNYYLGALWPTRDGMVRLIQKSSLIKWEGIVHEHAIVSGETGKLMNYFIHNTHRTLVEMVIKTNEWSAYEAKLRFDKSHPPISWWRLLRVMITAFFVSFFQQGGWKAGTVGWIESIYQAFSIFITYAKLWELQQKI
jgi:glycosyltransferase involved in cell wall biosynthesis